ncbi:hypothetical protein QAD02_012723 [Eretmocerus hayati]|uniref:Uncharacterized protein n=1 Tax=Eretmocerus hayati TaxID=131215 RepID=A0ACC2P1J2_9HYME|nr:hypothetical protein QAD02_012723 [Eretmocerus hayati]
MFFFAFNHQNYARYLTLYHDNLMNIDHTHPGLRDKMARSLGVRRNDKDFARQDDDIVLETTINNDSANKMTGTRNIMNNLGAVQRWTDSHTLRTEIIAHTTKRLNIRSGDDVTFQLKPCVIKKLNDQLDSLVGAFRQSINPFSTDIDHSELYNISTGKTVRIDVSDSLLSVLETGKDLREQFITECSINPARFEQTLKKQI